MIYTGSDAQQTSPTRSTALSRTSACPRARVADQTRRFKISAPSQLQASARREDSVTAPKSHGPVPQARISSLGVLHSFELGATTATHPSVQLEVSQTQWSRVFLPEEPAYSLHFCCLLVAGAGITITLNGR